MIKKKKKESSLAEHPKINNHSFADDSSMKLIKAERPKINKRNRIFRNLKIYNKNPGHCLNSKIEISTSQLFKVI